MDAKLIKSLTQSVAELKTENKELRQVIVNLLETAKKDEVVRLKYLKENLSGDFEIPTRVLEDRIERKKARIEGYTESIKTYKWR